MNNATIAAHHEVVFPPEIADRIMSYLHDDKAILKACSLTCRSWHFTALYHLYHTMHFHAQTYTRRFANLLTCSPHVGKFVREVSLSLSNDNYNDIVPIFSKYLGNVHTLSLYGQFSGRDLSALSGFGAVEYVRLLGDSCTYEDVDSLFRAFPTVADLAMEGGLWDAAYVPFNTLPAWPLKRLKLLPMLTPMTNPPSLPQLGTLTVIVRQIPEFIALISLLRANHQSIRHLDLRIYPVVPDDTQVLQLLAALELVQALRIVSLVTSSLELLASLMPRLQWSGIDKLTLDVSLRSMSDVDTLRQILSDAAFSNALKVVLRLQCMTPTLKIQRDMEVIRSSIEEGLTDLHARGVLSVII